MPWNKLQEAAHFTFYSLFMINAEDEGFWLRLSSLAANASPSRRSQSG
jgi:outer membrane scaffolding protein for murein synthesis (MipA/OmpV family)